MITKETLDAWKKLADEATLPSWVVEYDACGKYITGRILSDAHTFNASKSICEWDCMTNKDANFIASARTAVPMLIEEVNRLRETLDLYKRIYEKGK